MEQRTDSSRSTQVWKAKSLASGWWALEQAGKRLGVVADSVGDGAPLALVADTGLGTKWMLVDDGTGAIRIVNGCSGKILDVDGGAAATDDGVKVMQYRDWATKNQRWIARETSPVSILANARPESVRSIAVVGRRVSLLGYSEADRVDVLDLNGRRLVVFLAAKEILLPREVRGVVRIRFARGAQEVLAIVP